MNIRLSSLARRSRWATVGAVAAIALGSTGILSASASVTSGERATYIPITPCRIMDTRPGPDNVGGRATPIGPEVTHTIMVKGTNGNCTIPADAVGVVFNVAAINPTAASFLTVFPADAPRPLAANLNWTGGQLPLSNAVTADLSADGRVSFFNHAGTVDVAADVVGYFADHNHDDRYYTKGEVDAKIAAAGTTGPNVAPIDAYTKAETDAAITGAIGPKANSADVYTKPQTDTAIANATAPKANSADVYTKGQLYTKSEVDARPSMAIVAMGEAWGGADGIAPILFNPVPRDGTLKVIRNGPGQYEIRITGLSCATGKSLNLVVSSKTWSRVAQPESVICSQTYQSATLRMFDPATNQRADGTFTFMVWHSVYQAPA